MLRFPLRLIVISCAAWACVACGQNARISAKDSNSSADAGDAVREHSGGGDGWIDNGPTACEKYLTPELVGAVLKGAGGQSHAEGPHACTFETEHEPNHDFSTINIYLAAGGSAAFDQDVMTRNGTPLQGVGEKAVRTQEDGIQALKGDRICSIGVKPPYGNKLRGDAMALKLGEVCNKLFDLP